MFYQGVAYVSHLYVASVLSGCCICFTLMLQVFHPNIAYVFNTCFRHVSDVYVVSFQLFQVYVVNVSSKCCKSRYGVAHVIVAPICNSCLLQLLGPPSCAWVWRGRERQAWDTKRVRPWCGRGPWYVHRTRSGAGPI
jgi:hypothetical protein